MVSYFQIAILSANTIVLIYYGGKWVKVRSLHRKIEEAQNVPITALALKENVGKYVFITGTVKSLGMSLPSKYSKTVIAVVQNIQKM